MQAPPDIDYKALYEETKAKLELAYETIALRLRRIGIDLLEKIVYGSKQERFVPSNPTGDSPAGEAEHTPKDQEAAGAEEPSKQESSCLRTKKTREPKEGVPHPRRNSRAPHLTRITTVIEPDHVPEGSIRLPDEITRQLEYKQAEYIIIETIRRNPP